MNRANIPIRRFHITHTKVQDHVKLSKLYGESSTIGVLFVENGVSLVKWPDRKITRTGTAIPRVGLRVVS